MRNLLAEGIHPRSIHKTGSPIGEIFNHFRSKINESKVLDNLGLQSNQYFLVSIHRQENVDDPRRLKLVLQSLSHVITEFQLPLIVSTHPRTRKALESATETDLSGFHFKEPFGYLDYNKLQLESRCVISDSGTISEESAIMGFPAVTLRDSMERPEALDLGSILMSPVGSTFGLSAAIHQAQHQRQPGPLPEGYESQSFSNRVIAILMSKMVN
jgi:UDP-N-acetylglucosamine 2-epimerase (non-hydrolysing)